MSLVLFGLLCACSNKLEQGVATLDTLDLPGNLCDFMIADFEGDSVSEVLALGCGKIDSLSSRWGAVYSVNGKRFGTLPTAVFEIPRDAVVFDTGDIDNDGRQEILYLAGDGLYVIRLDGEDGGVPRQVIRSETVFLFRTPRFATHWDFFRTLPASGRNLIIMPGIRALSIYTVANGRVEKADDIPWGMHGHASSLAISENRLTNQLGFDFVLPFFEFLDYNGDGVEDLYIIDDDQQITVYACSFDGAFADQAISGIEKRFSDTSAGTESEILARDINGDGLGDLIVSRYRGGMKDLQSSIDIHLCRAHGGYSDSASFHHVIQSSAGSLYLADLNNDGRSDLVIPAPKIGIPALIKMLILNRVDMGLEVFLQQPGGTFPATPSMSANIDVFTDINSGRVDFSGNIAVTADFNGDNLNDFLIETGSGILNIYYGAVGTVFETEPGWTYRLPKPSSVLASDCDNDGISEIFAFYNNSPVDRDIIRVVHVGE